MNSLTKFKDKVISAFIYLFTYIKFITSKKIVYPLTFRGFYSEVNNLIFSIIYLKEKNKEIIIDSSRFSYSYEKGITDYLDSEYQTINFDKSKFLNFRDNKIVRYLFSKYYSKSYLFKKIRSNEFRKKYINKLSGLMKGEIENLYQYTPETKEIIDKNIKILDLPSDYVSFHIRRGDKVFGKFKEADYTHLDEYFIKLQKFIPLKKKINLYVATDDENILEEIQKTYPEINLYSLYSSETSRESEKDFLLQSRKNVKEHTLNLLTEVEILRRSKYFVGSFSSNLGRFVGASIGLENCISVDIPWKSVH